MPDAKFFQTTKRGEVQELKDELHSSNKEKKKEGVKKVIAAMTVGKDVSALFPDVVNCMQTTNVELKKLVYLYVINYAKAQPELAILAVNTFRKDSLDPNPLVRALAVRTMGCIRLEQITEYLVEPLRRCCKDSDPYVRKTAAICITKLYDISPALVEEQGFIEQLEEMLSDSNPMVVANSVAALHEISETTAKPILKNIINSNENNVNKLLAALNECTEWGQVFILDALVLYSPQSAAKAEAVLERILARLSHANSAVVLSAIKVVMKMLDKITNQDLIKTVQRKLCPPLITLLSAEPEIQYVALRNISLIVQKRPSILANEIKMFYCKYNDPVYVKLEKLDILVKLASDKNVDQVLMELKEYATEVDVDFVRKAVKSIGKCAIKLDNAAERCVNILLDLIETRVNYVVQEAIVVIKDIFRKYPNRYESIISALCENLDSLDESEAKVSMIWIIGEYAERIDNAEELLSSFLDVFHDETSAVQLQILTAIIKLFLKNVSQAAQDLVTRVLKMSTEESDDPDLRDRAYIYWRLLSKDPQATKSIVLSEKPTITDESNPLDYSELDRLIDNISMLASVYHKLPETFVTRLRVLQNDARNYDSESDTENQNSKVERIQEELEHQEYKSESDSSSESKSQSESSDSAGIDLLGLDYEDSSVKKEKINSEKPSVQINKIEVLSPEKCGIQGNSGVKIDAAFCQKAAEILLCMYIHNTTQTTLSSWALQLNKNFFGLSSLGSLQVEDISPGGSFEVTLQIAANQNISNTPPSFPLFVQAAVKNSLDVFYFDIPFDIHVVLTKGQALDKEVFKQKWIDMGEAKQMICMAVATQYHSAEVVSNRIELFNCYTVMSREAETIETLYASAVTTNNLFILAEISLQKAGTAVKLVIRSDLLALIRPYQNLLCKALNLIPKA